MSVLTPIISMMQEAGAAGAAQAGKAAQGAVESVPVQDLPYSYEPSMLLPQNAADTAASVDGLFSFVVWLNVFCFVGITAAVLYFVYKYRERKGHDKPEPSPTHNDRLEITWTVIPSLIVIGLFVFGWRGSLEMRTPPDNAVEIQVNAQKWSWGFTHYNGTTDNKLHVPVNRPVRLTMTSADVLHSLFIPAFRVKQDVVPKRYTQLWFNATKPGTYRLYCTEFCGLDHSLMKTVVTVHEEGGYEKYLQSKYDEFLNSPPDVLGKMFYEQKGCVACHTIDGSPKPGGGPSFLGLFGTEQSMADGSKVSVDENYLRESIVDPAAKVRQGYAPIMPKLSISDDEITAIIAYIKSLNKK